MIWPLYWRGTHTTLDSVPYDVNVDTAQPQPMT